MKKSERYRLVLHYRGQFFEIGRFPALGSAAATGKRLLASVRVDLLIGDMYLHRGRVNLWRVGLHDLYPVSIVVPPCQVLGI